MSFGKNLRLELCYHGIQLKEFAGIVDIAYPTLLTYVNSKKIIPKADVALKIAKALNTSVEFLFDGVEPDYSKFITLMWMQIKNGIKKCVKAVSL